MPRRTTGDSVLTTLDSRLLLGIVGHEPGFAPVFSPEVLTINHRADTLV
jgi:hypothetical protein